MTTFDDFDDDLSDLIGGAPRERKPLPQAAATFVPAIERVFTEPCTKCGGSGQYHHFGQCFACKGTGKFTFKTSPEQRAANRANAQKKAATKAAEKAEDRKAFAEAHKAELAWLHTATERQHENAHKDRKVWDLPISLSESLAKYGSFTDNQIALIRKCILRDEERRQQAEKGARERPACDASKIEAAFASARAAAAADGEGIMDLRLRLDIFVFSPSRDGDGSIWIKNKENRTWVGKIEQGRFRRFRACDDTLESRILAAAADPSAAAKAYGQRFNSCSCCGRTLTNQESRDLGIGPICRAKWGL